MVYLTNNKKNDNKYDYKKDKNGTIIENNLYNYIQMIQ